MQYLIIGGSIAGISAARAMRNADPNAEITVVSGEKVKAYYRPMIPLLINEQKSEVDILYPDDPIEKYSANVVYEMVTGVDVQSKEVLLSSGRKIRFGRLLIATGGVPIIPDIPGIKGQGVFTLRTMEDAIRIRDAISDAKEAVVIGGGFVGIKAAMALKSLLNVTIIEKLQQMLYQRLDRKGAEIIHNALKNEGIKILTNETIVEIIREASKIKALSLVSGNIINSDMVIVAIGVRPDIDIFKDSGIKIGKGIQVNELLQTNISDIYAAGDVVEFKELLTDKPSVSGLWVNAMEMGRIAGMNMAGANTRYPGFLAVMNATEIADIPIIAVGAIETGGEGYETITEDGINSYKKFVFKNDLLVGALFIGDIKNAGIYTNLIKNQIPISTMKERIIKGTISYVDFLKKIL